MTTVYIPRPIRTVEDAEGLPVGTVAIQSWGHGTTARTLTNGRWITPSGSALPHAEVIGFTALVPVEAEEETRAVGVHPSGERSYFNPAAARNGGWVGDMIAEMPVETRLVTPWEAVEDA